MSGLRARGGFAVGVNWKDRRLESAVITADRDGTVRVLRPDFDDLNALHNGRITGDEYRRRFEFALGRVEVNSAPAPRNSIWPPPPVNV